MNTVKSTTWMAALFGLLQLATPFSAQAEHHDVRCGPEGTATERCGSAAINLVFIRHATAIKKKAWKALGKKSNKQRPLTPEGRALFKEALPGISKLVGKIDHLYVSKYTRAVQTMEMIKEHLGLDQGSITLEPALNPKIPTEMLEEELREILETHGPGETICFVGHKSLGALLSLLITGQSELPMKLGKGSLTFVQTRDKKSFSIQEHLTQEELAAL